MKILEAANLNSNVFIGRHRFTRAFALSMLLLAVPFTLSAQTLQHDWSFNENGGSTATDSVAGANITLLGGTSLGGGVLTLPGGSGNYAQLPNGILSTNNSVTIETWLTDNGGETWARAWSFGGSTTGPNNNFIQNNYIDLIPTSGPGPFWTEFNHAGVNVDAESTDPLPTGTEEYTAVTYDSASQTVRLYLNGVQVAIATGVTITPASLGFTYNNNIGLDQYNDPVFTGTFDEMRIWSGPVSQRYLSASALAGPGVMINNLNATSASLTAGPGVVVTGTEQADVYVQLPQTGASELLATSDATNWISSNTNVLVVNGSGVITGVSSGTATVSATVSGIKSTSGLITVSPQVLLHRYSFVSDASDSVGGANWDGTIVAPNGGSAATIANGLSLPGNAGGGNGVSGYVSLPPGILTNTASITVECWVTQNQANNWAEIWDFGVNNNENFALIPYPLNNNNNTEVAFNPNNNDIYTASGSEFPNNSEQYVCLTFNSGSLTGDLYTNGLLDATQAYPNNSYSPGSIGGSGGTTQNMLGNDVYGDPQFDGTIYEFRIWNGAVSPLYVALSAVAGPSVVITNTTPQSLTVSAITSMLGSQTQNATVMGNFLQAANVPVTSVVSTWTSSDTNVLTVNGNGLITALSGGMATVSATVNGVTASSAIISVQTTAPTASLAVTNLVVVESESAVFSAQAFGGDLSFQWNFNGTPILDATNATLTLTNTVFTDAGTYSVLITNTIGRTNLSVTLAISAPVLLHRYSFVSDASDSVGNADGTIVAANGGSDATIANGLSLPGNAGGGYGVSGYVSLPVGILTNTASITVECWVTQNQANNWAEIWDFGSNNNENFALIPYPLNNNNNTEVAFNPNNNDIYTASGSPFPNGSEQYVCLTFNVGSLTGELYTNGLLDVTQTYPNASYAPGSIGGAGGTTQNMLGNDVYGDPQFAGTVYELRIWNGAVSPLYVALSAVVGPGVVVTNLTPVSISVSADTTIIAGETEQASATGTFQAASGVPVTSLVTNWISSNPSVLIVNSNGLITAVNGGAATVSATFNGITGVSSTITVPQSAPVITQEPAAALDLLAGSTLDADISVVGNPPFVYRWFFNGGTQPIYIATNSSSLSLSDLGSADAGAYTVLVSNVNGVATSSSITVTVSTPTPYEQVLLKLNPIAYWPLNEASGTTAYDLIGGNNGEYTNGFTLDETGPTNAFFGSSSVAAGFDGVTAYVDIPEGPFNITGAITVVAWVQLTASPGFDGLIGHGDSSWRMSINPSGQPGGNDGTSAAADATSTTGINDNNWHMVAYTYTGQPGNFDNGLLYVDGNVAAVNTIESTPTGNSLDVWIGGSPDYGTARLLPANIAHAAVFTQALTPNQVLGLYNGVYVAPPSTTIGIARVGESIVLTWQSGVLLESPAVNGPWTTVGGATSPYTVPVSSGNEFYRVLVTP